MSAVQVIHRMRGEVDPETVPATPSLTELEEVVERGRRAYIEMGSALREIRDGRRYVEAGFGDFDRYCRERWNMTRRHADRIIRAAKVGLMLRPFGLAPANEAQARE